jgi:hypothetical protein
VEKKIVSLPNGYIKKVELKSYNRVWQIVIFFILCIFTLFDIYLILIPMLSESSLELKTFILSMKSLQDVIILIICVYVLVILNFFIHEGVHWIFLFIFTGIKPTIHTKYRLFAIKTTCPNGVYCCRNQAIKSALSTLLISVLLGIISLIFWLLSMNLLFFLMNFLMLFNIGLSSLDILLSIWIWKYPNNYIFGFEDGVPTIYGA